MIALLTALISIGPSLGLSLSHDQASTRLSASEPENIIDSYDWDIAYDAKDATLTIWAGSPGPTLTAVATPTLDVSTAGLTTIGGIGSARENKAIRANVNGGFGPSNVNWPGGVWHLRVLFYKRPYVDAEYPFRIYQNASNRIDFEQRSNDTMRLYVYSGTAFSITSSVLADGWHLIDYVYDPTGGPGGVSRCIQRRNGNENVNNHTGVVDYVSASAPVYIGGGSSVSASDHTDVVFAGVRFLGSAGDFTLAMHQADVAALGL